MVITAAIMSVFCIIASYIPLTVSMGYRGAQGKVLSQDLKGLVRKWSSLLPSCLCFASSPPATPLTT